MFVKSPGRPLVADGQRPRRHEKIGVNGDIMRNPWRTTSTSRIVPWRKPATAISDGSRSAIVTSSPHHLGTIDPATHLLWAAHYLERIADRVINACERVAFAATGRLEELAVSTY